MRCTRFTTKIFVFVLLVFGCADEQDLGEMNDFSRDRPRPTSSIAQTWGGGDWLNQKRTLFSFDSASLTVSAELQAWQDTDWITNGRFEQTEDEFGNRLERIDHAFEDGTWTPRSRTVFTYNDMREQVEALSYRWGGEDWTSNSRIEHQYDQNGLRTIDGTRWDGGEWIPWIHQDVSHDTEGREEIVQHLWQNGKWVTTSRTIDSFNADGEILEHQIYVPSDEGWVMINQSENYFDDNSARTEAIHSELRDSEWVVTARELFSYQPTTN